jgi:hypothetical protein
MQIKRQIKSYWSSHSIEVIPVIQFISQSEGTVPMHNAQVYDPNGGSFQGLLSCFFLDFILEKLRLTFYAEI